MDMDMLGPNKVALLCLWKSSIAPITIWAIVGHKVFMHRAAIDLISLLLAVACVLGMRL